MAAATLVAELGDITRFANPRQFMAYLGLVPSEHSSEARDARGGITNKAGAMALRGACMLIEAAWSYRFPARIGRDLLLRQEKLSKPIRDIAWKAQERLLLSISQARPCGEIEDRDHRRDCARAFGLRLGDRETDATRNRLGRRS